jgi:hypothetical protein
LITVGTEVWQTFAITLFDRSASRLSSNSIIEATRIRTIFSPVVGPAASTPRSPAAARRQSRQTTSPFSAVQPGGRPVANPGIQVARTPQPSQVQVVAPLVRVAF